MSPQQMGRFTVVLSDDLHAAVKAAVGGQSVTSWIREAVAEKVGRSRLDRELDELRREVAELRQQIEGLRASRPDRP